jgi:pimeloyl-ACP methyl ester carboxylesterase
MSTTTIVMPTRDVTMGDTFVRFPGQGFPLVFIHGFTTTSEFWREQAEEFTKAYRVVRINLPGHGASPAPTSRGYRIEDFVEDVARVFQELNVDRAIVIGLSMGGIIAQEFTIKYPHLVEALVLVDTTAHGLGADAIMNSGSCATRAVQTATARTRWRRRKSQAGKKPQADKGLSITVKLEVAPMLPDG